MLKLPTVFFLISFSILAVVHVVSLQLFLYWKYSWLDIPVHFIGGSVVALGIFTLHDLRIVVPERWLSVVPIVLLTLAVALCWEVYELTIGIPVQEDFVFDTSLDLIMGVLGSLAGLFVGSNVRKI